MPGYNKNMFFHRMQQIEVPVAKGKRGTPVSKDYYDALLIDPNASVKEIKAAFRKLSVQHHPDKNQGVHTERYKQLSKAYEVLSNPESRICYDSFGPDYETIPHLDFFKQNLKHQDIVVPVDVTLEQCINGRSIKLNYNRLDANGSPEKVLHSFFLSPGVKHQQRIVFQNIGHLQSSKIPGNLVVIVNQLPDPDFQRVGNILIHKKTISLCEALSGSVKISHPNQQTEFVMHVDSEFQPSEWYRCEGQGATREYPMFVSLTVKYPPMSSSDKQKIFELLHFSPEVFDETLLAKTEWKDGQNVQKEINLHQQASAEDGEDQQHPQCRVQ